MAWLDTTGLSHFWAKCKAKFATKDVATTSSNGLMSSTDKARVGALGMRVTDDQSTSVSVPSATWKSIASVTLEKGLWVLAATLQFPSNSSGYRWAVISTSGTSASANDRRQNGANVVAVSGQPTYVNVAATKYLDSSTTFHLVAYQNSGSSLGCFGCITATRVGYVA